MKDNKTLKYITKIHHFDHRSFNTVIRNLHSCKANEDFSHDRLDPGNPSVRKWY